MNRLLFQIDPAGSFSSSNQRINLMKKLIVSITTLLLATMAVSMAAPDEAAMMEKEKAAWQAFKDKKPADFKKVIAADFVGVYDEGVSNMEKELSDMQKWDMKSFTISDYKVTSAGPKLVISSYVVKIEGTFNGKDASGTFNCGSVWHKRTGDWQAVFHTNVKQSPSS
jgi:hypothetical protein